MVGKTVLERGNVISGLSVVENARHYTQAAIRTSAIPDAAAVRLAWVRDTLSLDRLLVSANMAAKVDARPSASVTGPPTANLTFTPDGRLER